MPDWEYCSCPYCGNTLRLRPNQAEIGVPCPVCYRPVKLSEALAHEAEQERLAAARVAEAAAADTAVVEPEPAADSEWETVATAASDGTDDPGELEPMIAMPVLDERHLPDITDLEADKVDWSWVSRQELPPKANRIATAKPAPAQPRGLPSRPLPDSTLIRTHQAAIPDPEPTGSPSPREPARDQPRAIMAAALASSEPQHLENTRIQRIDWRDEAEEEFEDGEDAAGEGEEKVRKHRKRRFGLWGETPQWETTEPRARAKDITTRRIIRAGIAVLAVFLVLMVVNMFTSAGRTAKQDPNARHTRRFTPMVGGKPAATGAVSEMKALHDALITQPEQLLETLVPIVEKFLRGPTWRDKLLLARDPNRVGPLMEKYYATHPDKPVEFISAGTDKALAYKNNLLVLNVLMSDYAVRQIALEYKDGDFRVDWESFVGYCAMDQGELRDKRPVDPTLVRVSISPAIPGYFNYAFTDELGLECYVITFPDESYAFGYVEKTSPVATATRGLLGQTNTAMAVLTIRYPEGSVVGDQFWIHEVIAEGWVTGASVEPDYP